MLSSALRGAFVKLGAGLLGFAPDIIVFQFNPETVSRTPKLVQPPPLATGAGPADPNEQPAEPSESISFTLRLDATDSLASGNPISAVSGILPALSALELLLYPTESLASNLFAGLGADGGSGGGPYQNPPDQLPDIFFFWGPYRIMPVRITSLSINETLYDELLNPIRAEVSVSLDVVTKWELSGFALSAYKYTQTVKEAMAVANLLNPPEVITRALGSLL